MKKTLVFGASLHPYRYSNLAVRRLVDNQIDTVAFGKRKGEVAGVSVETDLSAFRDIHTISLYMNPGNQLPFYDDILRLQPVRVIFNPGTENPAFYRLLEQRGIQAEIACTLVLLATGQY